MKLLGIAALALTSICLGAPDPAMSVHLISNLPSPQPVGTIVGLTARLENASRAMHVYRYAISADGSAFRIVRDFSQDAQLVWSPALYEHEARIRVTVRDNESKVTADAELPYKIVPRVKGSQAVVVPTANPLVALLSAPACPAGSQFRATFRLQGSSEVAGTPAEDCRPSRTNNVYLAGMRADSDYEIRTEIARGAASSPGPWLHFHTGLTDGAFPRISIAAPRAAGSVVTEPLVIHSMVEPFRPTATDQDGHVVWIGRQDFFLTRVLPHGRFLGLGNGVNSANDIKRWQLVQELDVAGNLIRETNASRVAEQLESRGIHSDCKPGGRECVSGFHHEAIRLPNGHTLVIAGLERMFPSGTQGSKDPVDILGDLVIDLDEEFQVTAAWNAFDFLDVKKASHGGEKCKIGPGDDGCPAIFLASQANGWLHSNALDYIPSTGDFIVSVPEQDSIVKVDWKNGKGTGKVLWRLGEGGDFTTDSKDPYPWFSYQHDARFVPADSNTLLLFDDGHARKKKFPDANNRGQVWVLNEAAHTAKLAYNVDLGVYAVAVGSAQQLKNGGYAFEAGFINPAAMFSRAIETSPDGKIVYAQQAEGGITYRSFRVADMYSGTAR